MKTVSSTSGLVALSPSTIVHAKAIRATALDIGAPRYVVWTIGSGEGIGHAYVERTREGIKQPTESVYFAVSEIDTLNRPGQPAGRHAAAGAAQGMDGAAARVRLRGQAQAAAGAAPPLHVD